MERLRSLLLTRDRLSWWMQLGRHAVVCTRHDIIHEGQPIAHLGYFAAVFFEGHGVYSSMGGLLFVMGSLAILFKDGEP